MPDIIPLDYYTFVHTGNFSYLSRVTSAMTGYYHKKQPEIVYMYMHLETSEYNVSLQKRFVTNTCTTVTIPHSNELNTYLQVTLASFVEKQTNTLFMATYYGGQKAHKLK